ncbi:tetratricopeptide repeat-containing diguanylate cyclase [Chitinimonas sp. BJYL2]|uniref:tetratricopeptide repeat-containing diguanylate cyclase n=1 Tax=Chitinimonas sp. BJYL2 TaxID=2976696 RepID=UPI0022B35951|nr:tetratricopeptide repeat-containing diguanylate cyclase [Chitinimonas sp. BJYL2]
MPLTPLLRCMYMMAMALGSLAGQASQQPWREELNAVELQSDRDINAASSRLNQLRQGYATRKQTDALAYADSVDCYMRLVNAPDQATAFADAALAKLAGKPDNDTAIRLTLCRASGREQTNDLRGARTDYEQAIQRARTLRRQDLVAEGLGLLADLLSYQGDMANALVMVRDGVHLLDQYAPSPPDESWLRIRRGLLGRMANIYVRTEEPAKAIDYYKEVLAHEVRLGNTQNMISGYFNLGRAYEENGQLDQAMKTLQQSMTLAESIDDQVSIAWAQRAAGGVLIKLKRYREAQPLLNTSLAAFEKLNDEEMVAQIRYLLALVHMEAGDLIRADVLLNQALQVFRKNDNLRYQEWVLDALATVSARRGLHVTAYDQLRQQHEVHAKLDADARSKTSARLRMEFDTEKIEQQNRQLLTEQKFQQEQLAASQQIKQLQYIVIALVLVIAATLLVLMVRQVRAGKRLRTVAMTDELTGIANRRSIYTWAERQWVDTRENDAAISLILIDIDFFKRINDEFGHPMGDHVLKQVALCCQEQLRQMDRIGRVGGEEFMVVLPGAGQEDTLGVAERLREAVANLPSDNWAPGLKVSISLGVATRTHAADPLPALVQRADKALYQAKQNGRNRVEVATS